jgi:hypothetical protein
MRDQTNRAKDLIAAGKTAEAVTVLNRVKAAEPSNIMANYLLGLLKVGSGSPQTEHDGLKQMEQAVALIPTRPAWCARERHWYALYVTLGAQYYNRGDRSSAKKYYGVAYEHKTELLPISRRILLENLGRLSLSEGDAKGALAYYEEGDREGLRGASAMVAKIRALQ